MSSIDKALAYFSLFKFPISNQDLFCYLWEPNNISEGELIGNIIKSNNTCVEANFENKRKRLLFSEKKIKIALKAVRKIRSVPFVRAIFICNSVGWHYADEGSDVDLFIVTASSRIWIVRFFCNLILRFYRLRTYGDKTTDKICLSFFVTENSLDLSPYRVVQEDVHLAYWIHQMIPVFDPDFMYARFLSANIWARDFLPLALKNYIPASRYRVTESIFGKYWKRCWEAMWAGWYGELIESRAKVLQLPHINKKIIKGQGDFGVVMSDEIIKLHEHDTRQNIWKQWSDKLTEYESGTH